MNKRQIWVVLGVIAISAAIGQAASITQGSLCQGNCGSSGADGVVPLSPLGTASYLYVSTDTSLKAGSLPSGPLGDESTGSLLTTPLFSAKAGDELKFYFNYVTSDGVPYGDYAWAALLDSSNTVISYLFTARTNSVGLTVPGADLPSVGATLTPSSVGVTSGTTWAPLGTKSSGTCYDLGCGNTGWILSLLKIPTAGDYKVAFGATNWDDKRYQSGLAIDGVLMPAAVPEPATWGLMGSALIAVAWASRSRRASGAYTN